MRQVNECSEQHRFTTETCPVCEPDELKIKRLEREYQKEREVEQLVRGSTFFVPEPIADEREAVEEFIEKLQEQA